MDPKYLNIENCLYEKIKTLNETLWENKALKPEIEKWLHNFKTDKEKIHALFMLSKFLYYGASNMRILLKSLYRDLYRYPIIESIRKAYKDSLDETLVESEFDKIQRQTIFMGVGNPSESGAHLLYYFRQENKLSKNLFAYTDDVVVRSKDKDVIKRPDVKYYVFIDDFCGSGSQATTDTNVKRCVEKLRILDHDVKIIYLMLFATSKGIKIVKDSGIYDYAEAVVDLNETYQCFSDESRIFSCNPEMEKDFAEDFCFKYGYKLMEAIWKQEGIIDPSQLHIASTKTALGFGNCQLLLGFYHNTPDNTLPVFWCDEDKIDWNPIFKRYNKIYI